MKTIKTLHDNFGNTGIIEELEIYPYRGAKKKEKAFRLILSSDYDNNIIYHISIYETLEDVENKLEDLSCGTFKEI